jgi:hypothetical protein
MIRSMGAKIDQAECIELELFCEFRASPLGTKATTGIGFYKERISAKVNSAP